MKRENSQLKATEGRGNVPSLSENGNDLNQYSRDRKRDSLSIAVIWWFYSVFFDYVYRCQLPITITVTMVKYF